MTNSEYSSRFFNLKYIFKNISIARRNLNWHTYEIIALKICKELSNFIDFYNYGQLTLSKAITRNFHSISFIRTLNFKEIFKLFFFFFWFENVLQNSKLSVVSGQKCWYLVVPKKIAFIKFIIIFRLVLKT